MVVNNTPVVGQALRDRLKNDRQMLIILLAHIPVTGLLIPIGYGTSGFALFASFLVAALAGAGYWFLKGTRALGGLFAACLMLYSAIMIQAQLGRIEMHFHIFAALALLTIYRDWIPILVAAATIAVHHVLLTFLQLNEITIGEMPIIVFNYGCNWYITLTHAIYVVFESAILIYFAIRSGADQAETYQMMEIVERFSQHNDISARLNSDGVSAQSFNSMLDQFSDLIGRLRRFSDDLLNNATRLTSVSSNTEKVVDLQQQQMEQAAAATNQMSTSIQEVASRAQDASRAADQASDSAATSRIKMVEAVKLTEGTNALLVESIRTVRQVEEKVESIAALTAQISDISDQTNLLALNAAIEAARAGESGRGFSVVADEVRTLSLRTHEFTTKIRQTVDELTAVALLAVKSIETGQSHAIDSTDTINATQSSITEVEDAISALSDMNLQIASACEQQARTSYQINENIHHVTDQNGEIVSDARQLKSMADGLDATIEKLESTIKRYSVSAG